GRVTRRGAPEHRRGPADERRPRDRRDRLWRRHRRPGSRVRHGGRRGGRQRVTGADLLVETLRTHGVKTIFSLSGNQILSVYDATHGRNIDLLHTRHEAAATHMADGWGRLTESPGV